MQVVNVPVESSAMSDRRVAIAPRVLAPLLRDVRVRDVVADAPADLTLADLNPEVASSLAPAVARSLRRAVVDVVRQRVHRVLKIKPFTDMPVDLRLADLDLSLRAFNTMSRFPHRWMRAATLGDLLDTPGLGAGVLVEVLAAYEDALRVGAMPVARRDAIEMGQSEDELALRPVPERVLEMHNLYKSGATLADVATRFGLSRERVRQLFKQHGLPTRSIGETAALRRAQLKDEWRSAVIQLIDSGAAPRDTAERLDIPLQVVRDVLDDDPSRRRLVAFHRGAKKRPSPRYTDEEIIECLRTASVEIGGVLTTAEYTRFARTRRFMDGRPWPGHQTPAIRFGSWREALQRAGLEANPPSAIAGQRIFTRGHCVDAILEVERRVGHPPTAAEYERAATASDGVLPSLATVRHRCGGWHEALALAARFSC